MSNTVSTDEFETVKQLLASAARYAESANRGLDRLEVAQQQTQGQIDQSQRQIDQLTHKIESLADAQKLTEQTLRELAAAQQKTEATVERVGDRLESFIFESQRLLTKHSESIEQLKGMTERLDGVLAYLIRKEGGVQ